MSRLPTITVSDKLAAYGALARRSLQAFVKLSTKDYARPRHLKRLTEALEAAFKNKLAKRIVCHAPPRHGKTDTVLRFIAWCIWQNPKIRIAYCTYGADLSHEKARIARDLCVEMGVRLKAERVDRWQTTAGGGMWSVGVMGPLTGKGFDIIIIDDPYKNRVEAESPGYRDRVREWFRAVARTRLEPGGSIIVFATRWHPDDLSGTLIREGYENISLPAIDDEGRALWPERFDVAALRDIEREVHAYTWESLYQGRPRPRGSTVFGPPTVFTEPHTMYRTAFGVDLAYSTKTSSNWSVAVEGRANSKNVVQIPQVLRRQVRASDFRDECHALHLKARGARWRWYASTTEIGTADLFRSGEKRVPLYGHLARGDKLTRAQKVAAAWNRGEVQVPAGGGPGIDEFLATVLAFTGVKDACDDDVDALAAMYDELVQGAARVESEPTDADRVGWLRALPL